MCIWNWFNQFEQSPMKIFLLSNHQWKYFQKFRCAIPHLGGSSAPRPRWPYFAIYYLGYIVYMAPINFWQDLNKVYALLVKISGFLSVSGYHFPEKESSLALLGCFRLPTARFAKRKKAAIPKYLSTVLIMVSLV